MVKRFLVPIVIVLVGLLSGCGGDADHNAQDVRFARDMVPHHQQAIVMSDLAVARSTNPKVTELATRIKSAQGPEISLMRGWLTSWDKAPADHSGHATETGGMSAGPRGERVRGMVDGASMMQLGSASGPQFDRLFLESMTGHHRGAVDMAKIQLRDGKFEPALQLARQIIATQEKEIAEMAQLLSTVPASAP